MKKLLVASLIVPIMLLGAVPPAKAGNKVGAILTGVAVGIGAALILDALVPTPVVAAPAVVYPPAPVVVHTPPPVVYQPAPVVVYAPPVIVTTPPVVYHTPPPFVYRPAPVFVHAPRHVIHRPHRSHHHGDHGRQHWKKTPRNDH
jgi:hypothetical protein